MTTLNLQVAAGADDAYETADNTGFASNDAVVRIYSSSNAAVRRVGAFRFSSVTIPPGSTIIAATLSVWGENVTLDNPHCDLYCEDIDDSPDFATNADVIDRVRTTASVGWSVVGIGTSGYTAAPDIATLIQEVIDRVGWASANALTVIGVGRTDIVRSLTVHSYDGDPAKAAKLDITYTEPGGGALIEGKLVGRGILGGRLVA